MLNSKGMEQRGDYTYIYEGARVIVGRASRHSNADFQIFNTFVSREHCVFSLENCSLYVEDLNSKHGTSLNGNDLLPNQRYQIIEGDIITLVNGLVELYIESDNQITREITLTSLFPRSNILLSDSIQTIYVNDQQIKMPAKEYACFKLLYENLGQVITKEQIIHCVWNERVGDPDHLVADEEITSLIYRVRKRVKEHFTIKSIPHKGYYMEKN